MSIAVPNRGILSVAQIVGGDDMPRQRFQDPKIKQDKRSWYIRPWVDVLDGGKVVRRKRKIILGTLSDIGKREAIVKKNQVMATINRADYILQSQVNFGDFLDIYEREHVNRDGVLATSTRQKYRLHIKNHIRPAFEKLMLCEITTRLIENWLNDKAKPRRDGGKIIDGLSSAARADLRNIMSGIFTKAEHWGYWQDRNSVERVNLGRHQPVREKRKLSVDEQARIFSALPEDVCLLIETALWCSLRVSEVLGIQERDINLEQRTVTVQRRFYRGDLDVTCKTKPRTLPIGDLAERLAKRLTGNPNAFVFWVETRPLFGRKRSICRDDRDILQHFVRPVAKLLGLYYKGFGFHAFRREAITETSELIGTA